MSLDNNTILKVKVKFEDGNTVYFDDVMEFNFFDRIFIVEFAYGNEIKSFKFNNVKSVEIIVEDSEQKPEGN